MKIQFQQFQANLFFISLDYICDCQQTVINFNYHFHFSIAPSLSNIESREVNGNSEI